MGAEITPEKAKAHVDEQGTVPGPDGTPVDDLDKLWAIAKRWQVGDERVIGPIARARLVALGEPALARAIERLATKDGLEGEAVAAVLREFPRERTVPRLVEATRSADAATRKAAARFLGLLGAAEAEPRLVELLADGEARLFALRALAALGKAPEGVERFLRGPSELEGVAAASCLGAAADARAVAALVGALAPDVPFLVRQAAEQRLAALGEKAVPALAGAAAGAATARERRSALRALGATGSGAAGEAVAAALASPDPWVRLSALAAADRLLARLEGAAAASLRAARDGARAREADPLVRRHAPR
jgi:HEAT repeat protein